MNPYNRKLLIWPVILMVCLSLSTKAGENQPVKAVVFTDVKIDDSFWSPRLETNRTVTVPYAFKKCEETGRISNFAKAAGLAEGDFEGIYFNDSDLYKVIEGAAYCLRLHPDPELEKYVDGVIDKVAAAQWPDGYLYTFYSLPERQPEKRWTDISNKHELYCAGHFFEAACAYYRATGKRKILDVATRLADYIDSVFGEGKKLDAPGHQEIEIGLVKLYQVTGNEKYLKLAKFFLDMRGRKDLRKIYGPYCQDHKPVTEQSTAVGHAVRAGYLYAGMADVAALTGDVGYKTAMDRIWEDIVSQKQYLTGGVGARHGGEAFGEGYELPNKSAYNETCAAIANAMWNHRMFLLHGDAKYIDVLERVLYNGFLSGISMSGDTFFYPNPLASDGGYERSSWFGCACCPVNIARFIPSIAGYIYAQQDSRVYVNLFIGSFSSVKPAGKTVRLRQQTNYPWDGKVKISIDPVSPVRFALYLRIPGWSQAEVLPSDLYRYIDANPDKNITFRVNGKNTSVRIEKGFAVINRKWQGGDVVEMDMPMKIRRVVANPKVKADVGRVALQRGPLVYCAEGIDNAGNLQNLILTDDLPLTSESQKDLLNGVTVIKGSVIAVSWSNDGKSLVRKKQPFQAVPYYAWAHRGAGSMAVWLSQDGSTVKPLPRPTIASRSRASASHAFGNNALGAMNDLVEPASSIDHDIPRFTWWDHKGSREWVQYDLEKPAKVSSVEVYWFDDTGRGGCRVPGSWNLFYRDNAEWKPVTATGAYGRQKDKYNKVSFEPITTDALRIEVQLQPEFSSGILEWRVN